MYDISGLGARIRQIRMDRGFTQDAFAKELGISAQAVSKWETGAGCPDIAMLPVIANILETSIDTLFGETPAAEPVDESKFVEPEVIEEPAPDTEADDAADDLRVVHQNGTVACLSNLDVATKDDAIVIFTDGSSADLNSRTIVNNGHGAILFRDIQPKQEPQQETKRDTRSWTKDFTREVKEAAAAMDFNRVTELLSSIGDRVNDTIFSSTGKINFEYDSNSNRDTDGGGLVWHGVDIDSLDLAFGGAVEVTVEPGEPGQWLVEAAGTPEFLAALRCMEDGNVLKLSTKPYQSRRGLFTRRNTVRIETGFARGIDLDARLSGACDLHSECDFDSSRVTISGSGDMELQDAGILTANISGSGDISADFARNAKLTVSGSGDINIDHIDGISEIKISGSGDADITEATGELRCTVTGSGDVDIDRVCVQHLEVRISGSGDCTISEGTADSFDLELSGASDFDGEGLTVGDLDVHLNGPCDATIGRLTGKSVERVSKIAELHILQRG